MGAIIAASAICECCLGEIAKNFLDYSVEARSGLLGPMRPSFNIVKLLQQGLRKLEMTRFFIYLLLSLFNSKSLTTGCS